jgi:hypothetical protein
MTKPERTPTGRRPLASLAMLGGTVLGAAMLSSCSPQLATCDNPQLQTALRSGLEQRTHLTITSISDIQSVSRTPTNGSCTVRVAFSDGEEAVYTYTLTLAGTMTNFLVTAVNQTHGPNGAPPPSAAADTNAASADNSAAPAASEGDQPAASGDEGAPAPAEGGGNSAGEQ